jgi:hypothetical protein
VVDGRKYQLGNFIRHCVNILFLTVIDGRKYQLSKSISLVMEFIYLFAKSLNTVVDGRKYQLGNFYKTLCKYFGKTKLF